MGSATAFELRAADLPRLQRFFDQNPEYHRLVEGAPPGPGAAQEEFESLPPRDWRYDRKWIIAFLDGDGGMIGVADLIENLFIDDLWHLGLFMVATRLHGGGTAQCLYQALESWLRSRGCTWLRLGVMIGNTRAERFWDKQGYREVRKRLAVPMGGKVNDLRVMVKPLAGGRLDEYLSQVARDRLG